MTTFNNHYNYVSSIISWAKDRGILNKGRTTKQLLKSTEECNELCLAIESYSNGNHSEEVLKQIKDGIGDIYVTLVINTKMQLGFYLKTVSETFRNMVRFHKTSITSYKGIIADLKYYDYKLWITFNYESQDIECILDDYVSFLNDVARFYDLTLVECIDYAYNTIIKRSGKMVDGTYVKD